MTTGDIPLYGLRDQIANALDDAIAQIAPTEKVSWDVVWGWQQRPGADPQPVPGLILLCPSPLLGTGSMSAWRMPFDVPSLTDPTEALELVRSLMGTLRETRANILKTLPNN